MGTDIRDSIPTQNPSFNAIIRFMLRSIILPHAPKFLCIYRLFKRLFRGYSWRRDATPKKERDGTFHPSGTQTGPFTWSCTFPMPYSKLINRENGGDREPAIQRMNGSLWQPPNIWPGKIIRKVYRYRHFVKKRVWHLIKGHLVCWIQKSMMASWEMTS